MNSRERFLKTCSFLAPDRLAVDYQAHPEADARLRARLGCSTERELLDRLGADFYYLSCRDISQNEGFMKCYRGPALSITRDKRTCALGITFLRGAYDSKFAVDEAVAGPLENAQSEADILRHPWPKAADFDFSILAEECDANADRVRIGGLWSGVMGDSYRMHGFQNFLTNMALQPETIKTLINRTTDMYLELNDAMFSALKGKLDVWFFGNDFGAQNGLLFSQPMWRDFFYDPICRLTSLARSHNLKVMMHSCGGVSEIIPSLIDAGVDILDPIQVTARGMDPDRLVEAFGGKIVFHGGVDTQRVLPTASPDEVLLHARQTAETLSRRGGYIFGSSQILNRDVPVENIVAMYQAVNPSLA